MSASHQLEKVLGASGKEKYLLKLFEAGTTPGQTRAIANLKQFCDAHLKDHYALEVVNICRQPSLAKSQPIVAAPTLIKHEPLPPRRFAGDMSNSERLLRALD